MYAVKDEIIQSFVTTEEHEKKSQPGEKDIMFFFTGGAGAGLGFGFFQQASLAITLNSSLRLKLYKMLSLRLIYSVNFLDIERNIGLHMEFNLWYKWHNFYALVGFCSYQSASNAFLKAGVGAACFFPFPPGSKQLYYLDIECAVITNQFVNYIFCEAVVRFGFKL
jgi:hypothetical protein